MYMYAKFHGHGVCARSAVAFAVASFIFVEASALRRRTLQSFVWSLGSFAAGSRVVSWPLPAIARVSAVARVKLMLLLLQRNRLS